jgi:hypothetical protein
MDAIGWHRLEFGKKLSSRSKKTLDWLCHKIRISQVPPPPFKFRVEVVSRNWPRDLLIVLVIMKKYEVSNALDNMTHILSIWGWRNSCSKVILWSSVAVCILHGFVHSEQWALQRHSQLRRRIWWLRHITWLVLDVRVCVCVWERERERERNVNGHVTICDCSKNKPEPPNEITVRICGFSFSFKNICQLTDSVIASWSSCRHNSSHS